MKSASTSTRLVIEVQAAPPPSKPSALGSLAPFLVPAIIALIGWLIVERFARARERRSDAREMLRAFTAAIDDVTSKAREFYCLAGESPRSRTLSASIRGKIGALPRYASAMSKAGIKMNLDDQIREFRKTVTGGQFDERARPALDDRNPLLDRITAAGQDLAAEAQIAFYNTIAKRRLGDRLRRDTPPQPDASAAA